MSSYRKLGKNIALLTIGSFAPKILSFALVPLYTYALTTAEYGISDLLFTLCSLVMPVFTLYTYSALMRFSLDNGADYAQLFSITTWINIIGFVLLSICSLFLLFSEQIANYIPLFLLYFLAHEWNTSLLYFARGIDRLRDYSISTIINTALVILLNLLFLLGMNMRVEGYLLSYILALLLSSAYLVVRLQAWRYLLPIRKLDRLLTRKMLHYSIPLIPNMLSWWISNYSDKLIITYFFGVALSGIYAVSYKIPSMINVVSTIFISAWQISSVDHFGSERSKQFFSDVYKKYATLLFLLTSVVMVSSQMLGSMLYQKEFFAAWNYVPILTYAVMFHALSTFFGSLYTAAKETKGVAISTVIGAVMNIVMNLLLIPQYRAYGAAIATVLSYCAVLVVRVIHTRKMMSFKINYFNDAACCTLLLAQIFIALSQIPNKFAIGVLCFFLICVLRRDSIWGVFSALKKALRRLMKRQTKDAHL